MTAPTIAHARKMQLEAAAAIEATGWDERGVGTEMEAICKWEVSDDDK